VFWVFFFVSTFSLLVAFPSVPFKQKSRLSQLRFLLKQALAFMTARQLSLSGSQGAAASTTVTKRAIAYAEICMMFVLPSVRCEIGCFGDDWPQARDKEVVGLPKALGRAGDTWLKLITQCYLKRLKGEKSYMVIFFFR
jgi:hypothetical protein